MIHHIRAHTFEGSPTPAVLFLNERLLDRACCLTAILETALTCIPDRFPKALAETADAVYHDIKGLGELEINAPDAARVRDAKQVVGYLGIACGLNVSYLNSEGPSRPTFTPEQRQVMLERSIAAARESEIGRQQSLRIARMPFGDARAAAILRRADPSRARDL